jgi:hypothetical protein
MSARMPLTAPLTILVTTAHGWRARYSLRTDLPAQIGLFDIEDTLWPDTHSSKANTTSTILTSPRSGPEPDGDTITFRPDNPVIVQSLPNQGRPPRFNGRGMTSIRFEEKQMTSSGRLLRREERYESLREPCHTLACAKVDNLSLSCLVASVGMANDAATSRPILTR